MKNLALVFMAAAMAILADVNVWTKPVIPANDSLFRSGGAMVYLPDSNRFLLSMGFLSKAFYDQPGPYSEQVLSIGDTLWKNFLPAGKLGVWGDTIGFCDSVAYSAYFRIEPHNGIVRPSLASSNNGKAYYQYAYDSDEGKIYYYIENHTVCFDPAARVWEVLDPAVDPAGGPNQPGWGEGWLMLRLRWGAMAYDPVNREILLFGGGCASGPRGSVGTWTYKPSANTWTKLNPVAEPEPRALSPLVYDAEHRVIILFSGDHLDSMLGDTWVYACSTRTWIRKHPPVSPQPRGGHAMVYLPKSRKVVMFGGYHYDYNSSDDRGENQRFDSLEMWTYDVSDGPEGSWKLIKRFTSPEPSAIGYYGRPTVLLAAADTADRIVCIGEPVQGSRYYAYHFTWVMDCDPAQTDAAGTVAYGWKTDSSKTRGKRWDPAWFRQHEASVDTGAQETLLRNLAPNTWTYIAQPRLPLRGRSYGKAAISPERGVIFHWGGGHAEISQNDMPEYDIHKNRWYIRYTPETALEYDGSDLGGGPGNVTFNNHPFMVSHAYDAYDYCPILKKLLLFHYQFTFLYDPETGNWDTAAIPHAPSMVGSHGLTRTLNATPHGMVAWARNGGIPIWWILDTASLQWRDLPVKNTVSGLPSPFCEHSMLVYDNPRDRLLFTANSYGSPGTFNGQMWEYRFADSSFSALNPIGSALVNTLYYIRDAVYLPGPDQVLFQDTVRVSGQTGLGVYDCATNSWKLVPVKSDASAYPLGWGTSANSTPMVYDSKRDLVFAIKSDNNLYVMQYRDSAITLDGEGDAALSASVEALSIYPNPFNPSVVITAGGKAGTAGSLAIFDMSGTLVKASPFHGSFRWDATDDTGNKVPAGLYLIRLRAGNTEFSRKAILVK